MKINHLQIIDTAPNPCSTKEVDKMSLDRQGPDAMEHLLDTQMLIEILEPLLLAPGLIIYFEQDITDELVGRGFFNMEEFGITPIARDLLSSFR